MKAIAATLILAMLTDREGLPPTQADAATNVAVNAGAPVDPPDAGFVLTLGEDYDCKDASEPVLLDGDAGFPAGTFALLPDRIERVNCELKSCQVDRNVLREDLADAGAGGWQWSHTALTAAGVCSSLMLLYFKSRVDRGLPFFPWEHK